MTSSKVLIITGASSGIGLASARALFSAGHSVVLAARSLETLESLATELNASADSIASTERVVRARAIQTDVTIRAEVERLVRMTVETFGRVDGLINNAGMGLTKTVEETTEEDLDKMISTNVKSVLYGVQAVLPYFKAQKSGHIINVSSVLGKIPFASQRAAYSAAKHAVSALTTNLRVDLKNEGFSDIKVSLFLPGPVATNFGLVASGGKYDSRDIPNVQAVEEVAELMVKLIANPVAELYTREEYKTNTARYYSAPDLDLVEAQSPWAIKNNK